MSYFSIFFRNYKRFFDIFCAEEKKIIFVKIYVFMWKTEKKCVIMFYNNYLQEIS